jgi:hypothetical protein
MEDPINRQSFTCNGVTTAFPFSHPFNAQADLVVLKVLLADGSFTTLILNTNYTITGTADAQGHYPNGGTVNITPAIPSTFSLLVYRDPATVQPVTLVENDPLPVKASIEAPLNLLTMIAIRAKELVIRALRQPDGDALNLSALPTAVLRASKYLGFDATGYVPTMLAAPAGTSAVTAFMASILLKADAAAAVAGLLVEAISPAQITSTQNDYNPAGLATVNTLRINSDATQQITGLTTGVDGRLLFVFNVGSFNIMLVDDSAASTAANRFLFGYHITLFPNTGILLRYDGTSSRWRGMHNLPLEGTGISVNGQTISALNQVCNFRLTLTTGLPVTTVDVLAATTIYVTPYQGNQIGLYDGTAKWNVRASAEMSIAVPATTSTMYDLFCYDNASVPTLEALAWTNDTTRATALVLQNGVYVKSGATTRRYLGSFRTTTVSGQTEDSYIKRYVWNYYNRQVRPLLAHDGTTSWTYTSTAWRQARAASANQLDFVIGVVEDRVSATVMIHVSNSTTNCSGQVGIGLDSTTVNEQFVHLGNVMQVTATLGTLAMAEYRGYPGIGRHLLVWLEALAGGSTVTFYGSGTVGNNSNPPGSSGLQGELLG